MTLYDRIIIDLVTDRTEIEEQMLAEIAYFQAGLR